METLASWLAVPAAMVLVGAVASVRVVAEDHRAVVTRLGRTNRVAGPGVVFHVPVLEQLTSVSLRTSHTVVAAPALTRDGVAVHVTGTATCQVIDPACASLANPDPASATVAEVEAGVARAISHLVLLDVLPAREQLESAVPAEVNATTAAWGTRVLTLELSEFETRLTTELLGGARGSHRRTDT